MNSATSCDAAKRFITRFAAPIAAVMAVTLQTVIAATLTARGNEPGWQIEVTDAAMTFRTVDAGVVTVAPVPKPTVRKGIETYTAKVGDRPFSLVVTRKICSDTMTGMPHPKAAIVTFGERSFKGCAGEPASLLQGDWRIIAIGGKPIVRHSKPTLSFDREGRIHGNGSCNRYFGSFKLTGEGLSISETGASRMMCEQPLMDQEHNLLRGLESVGQFKVASSGSLRLLDKEGRIAVSLRR